MSWRDDQRQIEPRWHVSREDVRVASVEVSALLLHGSKERRELERQIGAAIVRIFSQRTRLRAQNNGNGRLLFDSP